MALSPISETETARPGRGPWRGTLAALVLGLLVFLGSDAGTAAAQDDVICPLGPIPDISLLNAQYAAFCSVCLNSTPVPQPQFATDTPTATASFTATSTPTSTPSLTPSVSPTATGTIAPSGVTQAGWSYNVIDPENGIYLADLGGFELALDHVTSVDFDVSYRTLEDGRVLDAAGLYWSVLSDFEPHELEMTASYSATPAIWDGSYTLGGGTPVTAHGCADAEIYSESFDHVCSDLLYVSGDTVIHDGARYVSGDDAFAVSMAWKGGLIDYGPAPTVTPNDQRLLVAWAVILVDPFVTAEVPLTPTMEPTSTPAPSGCWEVAYAGLANGTYSWPGHSWPKPEGTAYSEQHGVYLGQVGGYEAFTFTDFYTNSSSQRVGRLGFIIDLGEARPVRELIMSFSHTSGTFTNGGSARVDVTITYLEDGLWHRADWGQILGPHGKTNANVGGVFPEVSARYWWVNLNVVSQNANDTGNGRIDQIWVKGDAPWYYNMVIYLNQTDAEGQCDTGGPVQTSTPAPTYTLPPASTPIATYTRTPTSTATVSATPTTGPGDPLYCSQWDWRNTQTPTYTPTGTAFQTSTPTPTANVTATKDSLDQTATQVNIDGQATDAVSTFVSQLTATAAVEQATIQAGQTATQDTMNTLEAAPTATSLAQQTATIVQQDTATWVASTPGNDVVATQLAFGTQRAATLQAHSTIEASGGENFDGFESGEGVDGPDGAVTPGTGVGLDDRGFALDFSLSTVDGDCFVFIPETDLKDLVVPQVAVCVKWVQFPGITILDLRLPIELVLLWPLMQILRWLWRL